MEQELASIESIDNSPINMSTRNFTYNAKSPMEDTPDVSCLATSIFTTYALANSNFNTTPQQH
jgi:hypothetical protein